MTVFRLKTPMPVNNIRKLIAGDSIYLSGTIITARDQAHRRALEYAEKGAALPINFEGLALYHCGPIMRKEGTVWKVVAAGPTTSTRMEPVEPEFISRFKPRVIVGKGGMGEKTCQALMECGAIYVAFTGGAAVLAANAVKHVKEVLWLDLGMPEAMWVLEVEEFGPLVVAIDSLGHNLYRDVAEKAEQNKQRLFSNDRL